MNALNPRALKITALCLIMLCASAAAQTAGTFTDQRDGKTYRTVKIGEQVWMAENLDYRADSSWCYDNNPDNCKKYGRLYSWNAAMKACPDDWHLPTRKEWEELVAYVDDYTFIYDRGVYETAGTKLKSKSPNWNGTDDYGFSALPGGLRLVDCDSSSLVGSDIDRMLDCLPHGAGNIGRSGLWWTAAERDASRAYYRSISAGGPRATVGENYSKKNFALSVRCLMD
jgi:uncharacterized protein (TIGR02145 family)